jgi:hypothetical protein
MQGVEPARLVMALTYERSHPQRSRNVVPLERIV